MRRAALSRVSARVSRRTNIFLLTGLKDSLILVGDASPTPARTARARPPLLGRAKARRRTQARAESARAAPLAREVRAGASVPRDAEGASGCAVAANREARRRGPADFLEGLRARGVPTGPLLAPARPRPFRRRGDGQGRTRARDEGDRGAARAGGEPGVRASGTRARGSVSPAGAAESITGAECAGLCPSQCPPACGEGWEEAFEGGSARSRVFGAVVRGVALAAGGGWAGAASRRRRSGRAGAVLAVGGGLAEARTAQPGRGAGGWAPPPYASRVRARLSGLSARPRPRRGSSLTSPLGRRWRDLASSAWAPP